MNFRYLKACSAGLFLALAFSSAALAQTQIGSDLNGEFENDRFGSRVALSADGNRMVAGAFTNAETFANAGQVQVFENISGNWVQIGQDINGTAVDARLGQSVAISADGTIIAAGEATAENPAGEGKVRVFELTNGTWVQFGQDLLGSEVGITTFGNEVCLSADGSTLAVGSPSSFDRAGSVVVYQNLGGTWVQFGDIIVGASTSDDLTGNSVLGSGISLSADGLRLAAGGADFFGGGELSVFDFDFFTNDWTQVGQTIVGSFNDNDRLGTSVSLSDDGSIVAASAIGNGDGGVRAGAARVFRDTGGTWTQIGSDLNGTDFNEFGASVSLSGDGNILAVGAFGNGMPGTVNADGTITPPEGPSERIFRNENDNWVELARVSGEPGSFFGLQSQISSDGLTLAVGAQSFDGNGFDRGLVRAFDLEPLFVLHGDVNLDDIVNFLDIAPFISVLAGGGSPVEEAAADCNLDGVVSFLDIAPFIVALTSAGQ